MGGLAYMSATGSGTDKDYSAAKYWCSKSLVAAGPGDDGAVEYAHYLLDWIEDQS